MHEAIRSLARYPHLGHSRADLTARPLRFLTVQNHLIAYAPENRPVWIIAVIDGRRNPRTIAALLRNRQRPK
ncbi:MAG: type II toxin-antitoxin system RelE/ParE family toxin [Bryobacterales bacterium]|nr:type II toxin-antitoxin system RelE/ParE family toxin [Bryobacterales bacterium]